jgi:hypothetical protein
MEFHFKKGHLNGWVKGRSKELKMCNLKKTAAFEYFVSKLAGINLRNLEKSPSVKELDVEKLNNKLSEYSMTRYMKLLYFFCLTDAKREIYNNRRRAELPEETDHNGSLLEIFNNFAAYLNGPVEVDIYENRLNKGVFSLFTFEDGRLRLELRKDEFLNRAQKVLNETNSAIQDAIDGAYSELENKKLKILPNDKSILEQDTTPLVEVAHNLSPNVWPACFYYNEEKGKISELLKKRDLLYAEIQKFENQLM